MVKYYLIAKEGDGTSTQTAFRPMYIRGLNVNCAIHEVPGKDLFMVGINTRFPQKIDLLEKLPGVNRLDNSSQLSRRSLKMLMNVEVNESEDIIEKVGRICEPDFAKEKFAVSSD